MKPRDGADITCERRGAAELSRIARLGDYSSGGKCAHARNCCEQLSYLVRVESELDVSLESADSCALFHWVTPGSDAPSGCACWSASASILGCAPITYASAARANVPRSPSLPLCTNFSLRFTASPSIEGRLFRNFLPRGRRRGRAE